MNSIMKKFISLLSLVIILASITSCERKYYSISKVQLEKMENRIIKLQRLVDDAMYDLPPYSDTYDTLEEVKEEADKLLDNVYQVYDDDANN